MEVAERRMCLRKAGLRPGRWDADISIHSAEASVGEHADSPLLHITATSVDGCQGRSPFTASSVSATSASAAAA